VQTKLTLKKKNTLLCLQQVSSTFEAFFLQLQSGIDCYNNKTSNELLLASILFEESSAIDICTQKQKSAQNQQLSTLGKVPSLFLIINY